MKQSGFWVLKIKILLFCQSFKFWKISSKFSEELEEIQIGVEDIELRNSKH